MIGVRYRSIFILLHVSIQLSHHHLLRLSSPLSIVSLVKYQLAILLGFISALSVLFSWSICLFLCHQHNILMTITLYCSLKTRSMIPSALFFFLGIFFGYSQSFMVHINFRSVFLFYLSKKCHHSLNRIPLTPYMPFSGIDILKI